jgi:hypothetical protein
MKPKKLLQVFLMALVLAAFVGIGTSQAQQASITLKGSDVALCNKTDTEWSLSKEGSYNEVDRTVTWNVTATKGLTGANLLVVNGFVAVQNTGSADATIGNIVVNLQRRLNKGTAAKPKWEWVTVSSDVADATSGDGATIANICKSASSEALSLFTENPASGKLEFTDADSNTVWAIDPESVILPGETVNLLFKAEFSNTLLAIPAGEQVRTEVIVSFGNSGARSDKSSCPGVDINGSGTLDSDEAYVRSVPTRITRAVPPLNNCNSTATLKDTGVTTTGTVTYGSVDYQGYDAGTVIGETTTFEVTAFVVEGGTTGGQICNDVTLKGQDCFVSVITGYETATNPDGTTIQVPIYYDFPCCTGVNLTASACVDIGASEGTGFKDGDFCTFSQGGYGAKGAPYDMLANNFTAVFGSSAEVGTAGAGGFSMIFQDSTNQVCVRKEKNKCIESQTQVVTAPENIQAYLPASGPAGALTADLTNPTDSSSGVFGGQVLTLKINVAESGAANGTPAGFGDLYYCNAGSSLNGMTVRQILAVMETALGGGALPDGYSIKGENGSLSLNDLADNLNVNSFHQCKVGSFATQYLSRTSCP